MYESDFSNAATHASLHICLSREVGNGVFGLTVSVFSILSMVVRGATKSSSNLCIDLGNIDRWRNTKKHKGSVKTPLAMVFVYLTLNLVVTG